MTLSRNMFNTVDFFVKEFGKIDQRNTIIHPKEQECLEKYINTFIKDSVIVKTADTIRARKIFIPKPKPINIYFVTGISVDVFESPVNLTYNLYSKAGILKMNTLYGESYIILEDLFYTIFAHPYSKLNEKLEFECTQEEEDRLVRQYWVLNNFEKFLRDIGKKLDWPIKSDKEETYCMEIPTNVSFNLSSELSIDFITCLYIEMLYKILYVIHGDLYESEQDFELRLMVPFVYSYLTIDFDVMEQMDKDLKIDYSKILIGIAKKIGELNETSDVDDIGYAQAWIELFEYAIRAAFAFTTAVIDKNNKEEEQQDGQDNRGV